MRVTMKGYRTFAIALVIAVLGVVEQSADIFGDYSGHANPGHEPRDGWADDAVSISISAQRGSGG